MALGVLHHLDYSKSVELFDLAKSVLKTGGRLITSDGVYTENQSLLARFFISKDRGQNIRTEDEYRNLALSNFSDVEINIHHNLNNIPYTHIIMECTK